jgi:hypothetical protein
MSFVRDIRWTTWNPISSGFRTIELRGDRLESVGHVAPFVAPVLGLPASQNRLQLRHQEVQQRPFGRSSQPADPGPVPSRR